MRYWRLRPDARLSPWVVCYFLVEPQPGAVAANTSTVDEQQLLLPDGHSELVFRLASGFERWRVNAPVRRSFMDASYLIGGRSHSVLTRSVGALRLAGVKLDPRALRAVIDTPLGELRDSTLSLADLNCRALSDLDDAVANVKSVAALTALLDGFFLPRLCRDSIDEPLIPSLLEQIRRTGGTQAIMAWAREHKADARTLERRFVAAMGITPKQYARIVRFKQSYYRLISVKRSEPAKSHLQGYYDESHFNREFRQFLGVAPSAWLAGRTTHRTTVSDHLLATELGERGR
jgi:AraC-like DNA-binding protein